MCRQLSKHRACSQLLHPRLLHYLQSGCVRFQLCRGKWRRSMATIRNRTRCGRTSALPDAFYYVTVAEHCAKVPVTRIPLLKSDTCADSMIWAKVWIAGARCGTASQSLMAWNWFLINSVVHPPVAYRRSTVRSRAMVCSKRRLRQPGLENCFG